MSEPLPNKLATETMSRKHLRHARATPLASIFGSGFLVIVPILNAAVGPYSVVAMAVVCALAYAMGSVIRFNIRHAEPLLETGDTPARCSVTSARQIWLWCLPMRSRSVYTSTSWPRSCSVGWESNTPFRENMVTVIIVAAIGVLGKFRGLDMLMILERWALRITGVLILVMIAVFLIFDWKRLHHAHAAMASLSQAGPVDRAHGCGRDAHRGTGFRDVTVSGRGV